MYVNINYKTSNDFNKKKQWYAVSAHNHFFIQLRAMNCHWIYYLSHSSQWPPNEKTNIDKLKNE